MPRIRGFFLTIGLGLAAGSIMMLLIRPEPVDYRFQDYFKWLSTISFLAGLLFLLIFTNKWRKLNILGAGLFGAGLLAVYLGTEYGGQSVGSLGWIIGMIMISFVFPASLIIFGIPGVVSLGVAVREHKSALQGFLGGVVVLALLSASVVGIMIINPDLDELKVEIAGQEREKRVTAIRRLAKIDNYRATEALEELLDDRDPVIRLEAVRALARSPRNFMVVKALTKSLRDEDAAVRLAAIQALCRVIGPKKGRRYRDTVDELIERLKDRDQTVKSAAADSLGFLGDKRALEPLIEALGDEEIRTQAHSALMKLTDQQLGDDPAQWRDWLKNK